MIRTVVSSPGPFQRRILQASILIPETSPKDLERALVRDPDGDPDAQMRLNQNNIAVLQHELNFFNSDEVPSAGRPAMWQYGERVTEVEYACS
ncbi:hypothetical protein CY34DRAFT_812279 [Suillus luteus UH-Slu-Lm8-n1]|uniref:Uncharacterized protein n=1 Tax=Suillus luteus UH-Slu-Lm8-n1 TaxID=930992 RepID=A0A0C9ZCL7_9AGAM|nr:hypothetical protein CY34DRAFT_812279 [Suillus luteus UH-Slu-Lm8-n1]